MRADRAIDLDILVGDSPGLGIGCGGARLRGERGEMLADRVQSPAQVDRGRPRGGKLLVCGGERRVARILAHGEREPIGRGRADQRRPAHPHVADRDRRFVNVAQRRDLERMRQPALIDDVDAHTVFVEPDRPVRASVHLHEIVLLIPASVIRSGLPRRYHSPSGPGNSDRAAIDSAGERAAPRPLRLGRALDPCARKGDRLGAAGLRCRFVSAEAAANDHDSQSR